MKLATKIINCRSCGNELDKPFLDLGNSPLANDYEKEGEFSKEFPLAVCFCSKCYLVQLDYNINSEHMFSDYAYFSSYSSTFLKHAEQTVKYLVNKFNIDNSTRVLEIASNDGYLLKYMKKYTELIQGIDPAKNIASVANAAGIPTISEFFNTKLAYELMSKVPKFDVIIGNNVLAHVPDINDFLEGVSFCLRHSGIATFEFPYLNALLKQIEFDTIYHEHIFYYSIVALKKLFNKFNLTIFDVQFSDIHGGSIRIFVCHDYSGKPIESSVSIFEYLEVMDGLKDSSIYANFAMKVLGVKDDLLSLVRDLLNRNKSLAAYGAPAKGNTLLNYCGLTHNSISFTVDISPHKQGLYLPGSHIPIYSPDELLTRMPDYCLILPWNFKDEIISQQQVYLNKGGKFIIPIPFPRVIEK